MRAVLLFLLLFGALGCNQKEQAASILEPAPTTPNVSSPQGVSLVVLGTLQDAGAPQLGCTNSCCSRLYTNPEPNLMVTALGILDYNNKKQYLIEATPDIVKQAKLLNDLAQEAIFKQPDGIFITHGHIGHYSGLQFLGKESYNAEYAPIYVMPRMHDFIVNNGPWSLLLENANIALIALAHEESVELGDNLKITPLLVPHRDEFSETVGYIIQGPSKSALFLPDIDKWERWDKNINELIKQVDYAFVDATFYHGEEINARDITQIPHPFIIESMERFSTLSAANKSKIHFIHLNHTNPVLDTTSDAYKTVINNGFKVAQFMQQINL